ncbi:hypothetical protein BHM03_00029948, partial [Ensete ventricosum]
DRYVDRPLTDGTTKIGRRQSISIGGGRLREKSTIGGRLKKKKGRGRRRRRRRGKEEEEKEKKKYLAGRPRALAARGRLFSLRKEMELLSREGDFSPCARRRNFSRARREIEATSDID